MSPAGGWRHAAHVSPREASPRARALPPTRRHDGRRHARPATRVGGRGPGSSRVAPASRRRPQMQGPRENSVQESVPSPKDRET